jgi:hypothetical protein
MTFAAFVAGAALGLAVANVGWTRLTDEAAGVERWSSFRDALRRTATRKDTP